MSRGKCQGGNCGGGGRGGTCPGGLCTILPIFEGPEVSTYLPRTELVQTHYCYQKVSLIIHTEQFSNDHEQF